MCILHTHVMKIHILPDHFACFAYAFRVVAQARTSFPTWAGGCHGVAEICMPWIVVWKLVGPLLVFRCLFMRRKLRPPSARCMCYWCPPFPKESGFAGVNEKWMRCMVQWILSVVSFVICSVETPDVFPSLKTVKTDSCTRRDTSWWTMSASIPRPGWQQHTLSSFSASVAE